MFADRETDTHTHRQTVRFITALRSLTAGFFFLLVEGMLPSALRFPMAPVRNPHLLQQQQQQPFNGL